MKRIFLSLLSVLALATSALAQKTYVVATAVSNYEGSVNDLTQSTKDAKNLASLYSSKGATVVLLTSRNATRDNVLAAIRKVKAVATANDHIVFSYSGHGMQNIICTYASSAQDMLTYNDLFTELDACKASDIVCYIDACYSGTAVNGMHARDWGGTDANSWQNLLKSNPRYIVFLSSRANETSGESPWVGAGLLMNGVLKGLRGKADANNDKKVTAMELFKYVHKDVQLHNKQQHPQLVTSQSLYNNILMSW